jgi:hypothetical protein
VVVKGIVVAKGIVVGVEDMDTCQYSPSTLEDLSRAMLVAAC